MVHCCALLSNDFNVCRLITETVSDFIRKTVTNRLLTVTSGDSQIRNVIINVPFKKTAFSIKVIINSYYLSQRCYFSVITTAVLYSNVFLWGPLNYTCPQCSSFVFPFAETRSVGVTSVDQTTLAGSNFCFEYPDHDSTPAIKSLLASVKSTRLIMQITHNVIKTITQ